jgi:hypothetical protein
VLEAFAERCRRGRVDEVRIKMYDDVERRPTMETGKALVFVVVLPA